MLLAKILPSEFYNDPRSFASQQTVHFSDNLFLLIIFKKVVFWYELICKLLCTEIEWNRRDLSHQFSSLESKDRSSTRRDFSRVIT